MSKPIGKYAVINDDCISCGICEAACPENIPATGMDHYEVDAARCSQLACNLECQELCPVYAFSVKTVQTPYLTVAWGGVALALPVLTWTTPMQANMKYEIWGKVGATGTWERLRLYGPFSQITTSMDWTDGELYDYSNTIYYKIRAINSVGAYSNYSNIASFSPSMEP